MSEAWQRLTPTFEGGGWGQVILPRSFNAADGDDAAAIAGIGRRPATRV